MEFIFRRVGNVFCRLRCIELHTLLALLDEWNSGDDYSTRVANIRSGVGTLPDGTVIRLQKDGLPGGTVFDDGDSDQLTGSLGIDWFFLDSDEGEATDRKANKKVTEAVN